MNDNDDPWAEVARLQALSGSNRLSDRTWAVEEALNATIDHIARGEPVSRAETENLLTNRRRKMRRRRSLFVVNGSMLIEPTVDGRPAIEARSELHRILGFCTDREWCVLLRIGIGHSCEEIAVLDNVPRATVKTWLRRARLRLAA